MRFASAIALSLAVLTIPVSAGIRFNRDVRPILSEHCFQCHGPDAKDQKANLRLDLRASALKGGDSGPAIVAGKPEESLILQRVCTTDPDEVMPPPKLNKALKPQQVETLRQWIAEGATYEGHWAFIPPVASTPPQNGAPHPVDAFINEELSAKGLTAQPEAPRAALIRRVALDLTGLPPSSAELTAFLADTSPQAYETMVDRYLASPHYGEQMALQWLDFARYADSHGFQSDSSRRMHHWRDWLINAYNSNKPFDAFTIEQLAGDMLPTATQDQIIATGFNRNHRLNGESGRIVEEWFTETVIDRVETTGMTWMGLTFNCCRCHDHKYDPISQKEFFQVYAYFNSVKESGVLDDPRKHHGNSVPRLDLPTPEEAAALQQATTQLTDAEASLRLAKATVTERLPAWREAVNADLRSGTAWHELVSPTATSKAGATFTQQADHTWLVSGANTASDVYTIKTKLPEGHISGVLVEVMADPSLPTGGFGRGNEGTFHLSEVEAELSAPTLSKPVSIDLSHARAETELKSSPAAHLIKKSKAHSGAKDDQGWAIDATLRGQPIRCMITAAKAVAVPANATLKITLRHQAKTAQNLGRFRLAVSHQPAALLSPSGFTTDAELRAALIAHPLTERQTHTLATIFQSGHDSTLTKAEDVLEAAKAAHQTAKESVSSVMVMQEAAKPKQARRLDRGEYDRPAEPVERALPAFLPPLPPGEPNNRLGFARWLVSGTHPLTGRVWVNRAWERFFGTGLTKTTENLGSQSEWPSHPELLDYLAVEFVRLKWDMKAMHRLLVTSAAYRRSTKATAETLAKDPENRFYARGPRFRLSGEALRDQSLAISGLLVPKLGGPSVKPYMPERVWDETSVYGDLRNYKADEGDGLYRRSLYTIWKRTAAPPSMALFDAPSREICTVKRGRTNTPLQSLSLLNEVTHVEAARVFAQRVLASGGSTDHDRLRWAFRTATSREPRSEELTALSNGLIRRLELFKARPADAEKLLTTGKAPLPSQLEPIQLAAWTMTANVLLNLDEVVTRE